MKHYFQSCEKKIHEQAKLLIKHEEKIEALLDIKRCGDLKNGSASHPHVHIQISGTCECTLYGKRDLQVELSKDLEMGRESCITQVGPM